MQRRGSLTRSEGTRSEGLAAPESREHAVPWEDPVPALQDECKRLQLLVGELVLKNHELRSQVTRLRDKKHEFSG
jgi:hypothetical protein